MIRIIQKGSFSKTDRFLSIVSKRDIFNRLEGLAKIGVEALARSTPSATGKTASSWNYEVENTAAGYTIHWTNSNLDSAGTPIAILLQYGHGTGTGGYVQGRDYINPAMQPVFDSLADAAWKAVTSA